MNPAWWIHCFLRVKYLYLVPIGSHEWNIPVLFITLLFLTWTYPARMEFGSGPGQLSPESAIGNIVDSIGMSVFCPVPTRDNRRKGPSTSARRRALLTTIEPNISFSVIEENTEKSWTSGHFFDWFWTLYHPCQDQFGLCSTKPTSGTQQNITSHFRVHYSTTSGTHTGHLQYHFKKKGETKQEK